MNVKTFNRLATKMLADTKEVLVSKGKGYVGAQTDRLYSFKKAAEVNDCCTVTALQGMVVKHDCSVLETTRRMELDPEFVPTQEWVDEKLGDRINYNILLAALIKDRRDEIEDL